MPEPITYSQRHKDLVAHQIVYNEDGSIEVYGRELDGTTTWIWIHKGENLEIKDYRETPRVPEPVEYEIQYVPHAHTGQPVAMRVPKRRGV